MPHPDIRPRIARMTARFWERPARSMGLRHARWDDVWAADPGSASAYPNSATLLEPVGAGRAREVVERVSRFYAAAPGGGWLLWSAWPTPDLAGLGLRGPQVMPIMLRAPRPVPPRPGGLRVVEVSDAQALVDAERVLVEGYPAPELTPYRPGVLFDPRVLGGDLRLWVGYADGVAVATAAACVAEGLVGVFDVATLPGARRRGYGGALTAAAMAAAPWLPAVLTASDAGRSLYARMGFRVIGEAWVWQARQRAGTSAAAGALPD